MRCGGFKKGFVAVVPRARRSGISKGKQGFVKIPVGEMKVRLCVRERRRRGADGRGDR